MAPTWKVRLTRQPGTETERDERVPGLAVLRNAVKDDKGLKFTALLHHLMVDPLRECLYALKRKSTGSWAV